MPTVLRIDAYRFFYSNENDEPAHVHIKAGDSEAKFWLHPVALESNYGFRDRNLNEIERLVHQHRQELVEGLE